MEKRLIDAMLDDELDFSDPDLGFVKKGDSRDTEPPPFTPSWIKSKIRSYKTSNLLSIKTFTILSIFLNCNLPNKPPLNPTYKPSCNTSSFPRNTTSIA